jgi:ABC-type amino acid transport substrate-binding protein
MGTGLKATEVFDVVGAYFLLNKSEAELQKRINEALAELKADGWLPALSKQYFNVDVYAEYDGFHPR